MMKKLFYFALATLTFIACTDNKEPQQPTIDPPTSETISFEESEKMLNIDGQALKLGEISVVSGKSTAKFQHVYWAKDYTEVNQMKDENDQLYFAAPLFSTADGNAWFSSYYCDCTIFGAQYDAWGGIILSSNANTTLAPGKAGMANQFEAYAHTTPENTTFAVCYDAKSAGMAMSADCCWPQIDFTSKAREVKNIALCNSTWTYDHFKGASKDSYAVKIMGKKDGKETATVVCPLIEGATKVNDWKVFDISALGTVDQLIFTVVSSDPYAPFYFCMDNLLYNL
ncbi:MAG: DUF4465 domain-containing protein [Alistipes sp.]